MKNVVQFSILIISLCVGSRTFSQEVKKQPSARTPVSSTTQVQQTPNTNSAPAATPKRPASLSRRSMAINEQGLPAKKIKSKPAISVAPADPARK